MRSREVQTTREEAEAAVAARPDLPPAAVAAAWEVGPAAALALARNHPTPQALTAEEEAARRALEMKNRRELASQALEVLNALEGLVDGKHVDDDFKGNLAIVIGSQLPDVRRLAEWEIVKRRGEAVERSEWLLVKAASSSPEVKAAVFRGLSIVLQVRAERHAKKRLRKKVKAS
ncbi:MAG TPA: hypothetical protein VGK73_36440 [Polyangiaceae bacterium]